MKRVIVFPVALALFPALFLYAHNENLVDLRELLVPAALSVGIVLGLWGGLWLLTRDVLFSALLATLWTFSLLSFGAFRACGRYSLALWGVSVACLTLGLVVFRRKSERLRLPLNIVSCVLLILPFAGVVRQEVRLVRARHAAENLSGKAETLSVSPVAAKNLPNIVHIVLDGYARSDVLRDLYGLDNRAFLRELETRGFVVAEDSYTNYWQTQLSLASTLNLSYLRPSAVSPFYFTTDFGPHGFTEQLIQSSLVMATLKKFGYLSVAFSTGYPETEVRSADVFREPGGAFSTLTLFQAGLLEMTPLPALSRLVHADAMNPYEAHRKRILFTLGHLSDISDREAPLFVFAHVVCPHPPFVFTADGRPIQPGGPFTLADGSEYLESGASKQEYRGQYRDQVRFVNSRALQVLDRLLARASRPTVVVLQADHGPGSGLDWNSLERSDLRERFAILLALRAPGFGQGTIPQDLDPVNLYRLLFSQYFGARLSPLEHRQYGMLQGKSPHLVRVMREPRGP